MALLDKDRDHMDAIELKPFEMAIAHGVDAIMTAHMAVPAIEPEGHSRDGVAEGADGAATE